MVGRGVKQWRSTAVVRITGARWGIGALRKIVFGAAMGGVSRWLRIAAGPAPLSPDRVQQLFYPSVTGRQRAVLFAGQIDRFLYRLRQRRDGQPLGLAEGVYR